MNRLSSRNTQTTTCKLRDTNYDGNIYIITSNCNWSTRQWQATFHASASLEGIMFWVCPSVCQSINTFVTRFSSRDFGETWHKYSSWQWKESQRFSGSEFELQGRWDMTEAFISHIFEPIRASLYSICNPCVVVTIAEMVSTTIATCMTYIYYPVSRP